MKNKRKEDRLFGMVKVFVGSVSGEIQDISYNGLCFKSDHDFSDRVGDSKNIVVRFPDEEEPEGVELLLAGKICHTKYDQARNCFLTGFEFETISSRNRKILNHHVDLLTNSNGFWGLNFQPQDR